MYNPEKEPQFNALPLPYHARKAAINGAFDEILRTPAVIAFSHQEQRQAKEAIAAMPIVESAPLPAQRDQMQNMTNVVILDDHRDRNVNFARDAVDAVFDYPESGYVQETA